MKRIALIIWGLQISGGGARQILELALSIKRLGNNVDIFCVDIDREKCYPQLLKQLNVYSIQTSAKKQTYLLAKYSTVQKFINLIPHFINKRHNLLALRDLIQIHDDKYHYDVFNYHETEVYKLAKYFNAKENFWMMNDLFIKGNDILETLYRHWTHFEYRLIYSKKINKIIVLDNINKEIVKKYLNTNAIVVRSGLNQKDFYIRRLYKSKKVFSILATGIFFPHRRYEDLIEALHILINKQKIKTLILTVIGEPKTDITYFKKIQNMVEVYNLREYVHFLGRVSEQVLRRKYKTSDIFVFPNSPQTWGLAVFEAMLAGCAVIVSRGAGAHEVLENNKTALLVDPNSPLQIAKAIKKLLLDPQSLKRISLGGQEFARENISWDKYAKDMLSIFERYG